VTQTVIGPTQTIEKTLPGPTVTFERTATATLERTSVETLELTVPGPTLERTTTLEKTATFDRTLTRDITETLERTRTIATTEVLTYNQTITEISLSISTQLSTITLPVRIFRIRRSQMWRIQGLSFVALRKCAQLEGSPLTLSESMPNLSHDLMRVLCALMTSTR